MLGTQGQPLARVETGELGKLHVILFCSIHVWGSIKEVQIKLQDQETKFFAFIQCTIMKLQTYVSCMVKLEMELQMTLKHTAYVAFKT